MNIKYVTTLFSLAVIAAFYAAGWLTPWTLLGVIGLAPLVVIGVLLIIGLTPWATVFLGMKVHKRTAPIRRALAARNPFVEVSSAHWRKLFTFQLVKVGFKSKHFTFEYPGYQGEMRPEILQWCQDNLTQTPRLSPRYVQPENSGVPIFLTFATQDDAFAFKMRWL